MALIKCPECGKEISDRAKKCLYCGKVLIDDKTTTKICSDCGKENPIDATECIYCGCPFDEKAAVTETEPVQTVSMGKSKRNLKKIIVSIAVIVAAVAVSIIIYDVKVIKPKNTYNEAMELLENGKYEDANKLLNSITGYKDVVDIKKQIKWESRVYECITDLKQYLKNPDSLQVYEVAFYDGYKSGISDNTKTAMEGVMKLTGGEPVCVIRDGGQNGFGGNTTGYSVFLYNNGSYKYVGDCDTLDEDEVDEEDKSICQLINIYKDNLKQVGDVDLSRIKSIIKNDSYSTIKIIK